MLEHEKMEYQQAIKNNQHEVFVVSIEEMDGVIKSLPPAQRKKAQATWDSLRSSVNVGASYYASATDAVKLTQLTRDLGGIKAKAYVKVYGGKPHIIIKGHPGLRKVLTGTKYGIKNPKVVSMGLGRHAAVGAAKCGGIVSIVLMSAYRVVDYVLTDEATLFQLVGTIATDIVKIGIVVGASVLAAAAVGTATVFAIGPIMAVLVVGVVTAAILERIDTHFGITKRVIAGLEEMGGDVQAFYERRKSELIRGAAQAASQVISHAVDTVRAAAINLALDTFKRTINSRPKL